MKPINLIRSFVLASSVCLSASAQNIGWTPVTSGNMQYGNQPQGSISWNPVGSNLYGSDGSSAYQSGGSTIYSNGSSSYNTGNVTVHSDGTRTHVVGDTLYGQNPNGTQFYCRMQGGQAVCHPR